MSKGVSAQRIRYLNQTLKYGRSFSGGRRKVKNSVNVGTACSSGLGGWCVGCGERSGWRQIF